MRTTLREDAFDIGNCEQSSKSIGLVDDEQFVNSDLFIEEAVCTGDWIIAKFVLKNGLHLRTRRHGIDDPNRGVTRADNVTRKQTDELIAPIHHWERPESVTLLLDQIEDVTD